MKTHSPNTSQHGSALILVLGILSVMLLMAVSFATFMRTERSGTTNLKNSYVSRQAVKSAITHVIDSIDLSFDNPTNGQPVAVWPNGFICSSAYATNDYFHARSLEEDERAEANILNAEIARFLTPSQLALARTADVQWAPLYGGLRTMGMTPENQNTGNFALYGDGNTPEGESLVGRYAFVVLDTTGLLDVNATGVDQDAQARAESNGSDPTNFILPTTDTQDYPHVLTDPDNFLNARANARAFFSFNDLRTACAAYAIPSFSDVEGSDPALDLRYPGEQTEPNQTASEGEYFPADLFSSAALSLDELTPEGQLKVNLPTEDELDKWSTITEVGKFLDRAFPAMIRVFARSRGGSDEDVERMENDGEEYEPLIPFYEIKDSASYSISRARLATVAMIDAMDENDIPGNPFAGGAGTGSIWDRLNDISDLPLSPGSDVKLHDEVTGNKPGNSTTSYLDYPCTEAIPMVDAVFGRVNIDVEKAKIHNLDVAKFKANPSHGKECEIVIPCTIVLGVEARYPNLTTNAVSEDYTLEFDYEILSGLPKLTDGNHRDFANVKSDYQYEDIEGDSSLGSYINWRTTIDNDPEFKVLDAIFDKEPPFIGRHSKTKTINKGKVATGNITAEKLIKFEIVLRPIEYPVWTVDSEVDGGGYWSSIKFKYPVPIGAEATGDTNVDSGIGGYWMAARFNRIRVKRGDTVLQQVPGLALCEYKDDDFNLDKMRSTRFPYSPVINMAIYNDPGKIHATPEQKTLSEVSDSLKEFSSKAGTSFSTTLVKTKEDTDGKAIDSYVHHDTVWGWSLCAAPAFAFDTSSIANITVVGKNGINFRPWLNDYVARLNVQSHDVGAVQAFCENLLISTDDVEAFENLVGSTIETEGHDGGSGVPYGGPNAIQEKIFDKTVLQENNGEIFNDYFWYNGTLPDMAHADCSDSNKDNGKEHFEHTFAAPTKNSTAYQIYSYINDLPFASPGDLGDVMCGPLETISLFETFRLGTDDSDFHRVFDYFTTEVNRYPTSNEILNNLDSNGDVKSMGNEKFIASAPRRGRVNLNASIYVKYRDDMTTRAEFAIDKNDQDKNVHVHNPWPLVTAFNGASYQDLAGIGKSDLAQNRKTITEDQAFDFALSIIDNIENISDTDARHVKSYRFKKSNDSNAQAYRNVYTSLAQLGAAANGDNFLLQKIIETIEPTSDHEREELLRQTMPAFTTRGQSYIAIIRADAFTAMYGSSQSLADGVSLATSHAIVEFFRDPEPMRQTDGTLVNDGTGPIAAHGWIIRSIRIF